MYKIRKEPVIKELFDGAKKFQKKKFRKDEPLYRKLSKKQEPPSLFITCSDSRVNPYLITGASPGDLFVIRNIANIVPLYGQSSDFPSTSSSIEYAVNVLKVKNIVICGHSDCGGCKALFLENFKELPYTKKWLKLLSPLKSKFKELNKKKDYPKNSKKVEQENIILQIENLLTYPFINEKYRKNNISIYGWYYDIGRGLIYNYDKNNSTFNKIE